MHAFLGASNAALASGVLPVSDLQYAAACAPLVLPLCGLQPRCDVPLNSHTTAQAPGLRPHSPAPPPHNPSARRAAAAMATELRRSLDRSLGRRPSTDSVSACWSSWWGCRIRAASVGCFMWTSGCDSLRRQPLWAALRVAGPAVCSTQACQPCPLLSAPSCRWLAPCCRAPPRLIPATGARPSP